MHGARLWPSLSPRRPAAVLAPCLLAFSVLFLPASANAGFLAGSGQGAQVTLHGTGGYRIDLSGAVEGAHSTVTLAVGHGDSSADYTAPGTITPAAIHASFGRFGKVALHFRSFRVQHARLSKKCRIKGVPAVTEARVGVLVGTVRFRGEGGYTQVSAHRVRGGIGEVPAVFTGHTKRSHVTYICATPLGKSPVAESPEAGHPQRSQSAVLIASTAGGATSFAASDLFGEETFLASVSEKRGEVTIHRSVISFGPVGGFVFDNALSTATLAPPAPFTGSASFQRAPDGTTAWTGDLATTFLGRGAVALAGPAFKATLAH